MPPNLEGLLSDSKFGYCKLRHVGKNNTQG